MPSAKSAKKPHKKATIKKRLPKLSNSMIVLLAGEYYKTIMPAKKSHRRAVWAAFFVVSGILAIQLLYPLDWAVPFARIGDSRVGFQAHDELAKQFGEKFSKTNVRLRANNKVVEYPLKTTGAELNTEKLIEDISEYPFWQRFIPLSLLWQVPHVKYADVYYTDQILKRFSDQQSKKLTFPATNARLAIKDGILVATPEVAGSEVIATEVHKAIGRASVPLGVTSEIKIHAKRVVATRTMSEFSEIQAQAARALSRTVTIVAQDKPFTPTKGDIASWLILDTNQAGKPSLRMDSQKVNEYIKGINQQAGEAAGQTDIRIVNGREVGRTAGKVGRSVDEMALIAELNHYILENKGTATITAKFIEVQPSVIYNSKYTATHEGLQAYVNDQGRTKNVHIDIRQLSGAGWAASTRANESIPSASTYKLFVSLMLFDKMKKGETSWGDSMLDTTVSTCFDRMTIASTNPCAEKWLAQWGRSNINSFIYNHGFSTGTTFTSTVANHTTAADLTKFMIGLNDGSLVQEPYRSRLIHSLSVHPYGYGIPTGSSGKVYDKVGFLWDYVHDTAIVKHPRGTYAMTVMTKGQSYAAIASITREVERIMYP